MTSIYLSIYMIRTYKLTYRAYRIIRKYHRLRFYHESPRFPHTDQPYTGFHFEICSVVFECSIMTEDQLQHT